VDERKPRPGLIGPLMLITVGVLLLLNQAGALPWRVWGILWRFWPVVLILIGLDILVKGSRSLVVYIIGLLIAVTVLGGVVAYTLNQSRQDTSTWQAVSTDHLREGRQDADRGDVGLRFGAGTLAIRALSDSSSFVEGTIEYGQYSAKAREDFGVQNGRASFSLEAQSPSLPGSIPGLNIGDRWDLKFTRRIPLDMSVDAGVGKVEIDLRDLKATTFSLKTGVGEVTVTVPAAAGKTRGSVDMGIGSITVLVPHGVAAQIDVSRALCTVRVDKRFVRSGDIYETSDYDTATNKIELDITCAIGTITVR